MKTVSYMSTNSSAYFKTMSIIHLAMVGGTTTFAVFTYLNNKSFIAALDPDNMYIYVVPIIAAAGYFLSQFLFSRQVKNINRADGLNAKMAKYQSASIVKYTLLEGPAFLAIIAYGSSGNALFLVITIFLIVYLFIQKPSQQKFMEEVPLTMEDKKEMKSSNTI